MPFPNLDGRPSSYTDDVPSKVAEFVKQELEEKNLPTRAGLSNYIGISKKTLIKWGEEHEQLLHALAEFDQLQENEVWQKALKGEYNSNIAKLMLHNHGYSDKSESKEEIVQKTEHTFNLEDIEERLEKLKTATTQGSTE